MTTARSRVSRRSLLLGAASLALAGQTQAAATPPEITELLPQARLQGSGRLTFFGLFVYDARLWSTAAFRSANYSSTPLAIELDYGRTLYGKLIAERSLTEMRKLGEIAEPLAQSWQQQLIKIIPDVAEGDRITGVQRPGESTRFFFNGRAIGEIRDGDFTRLFFGIWLSPNSSEPKLRQALIGQGAN